jgi:hypothetical protein
MKSRISMLMFLGVLLTGCSLAQVRTDCSTNGTSSGGQINATTNCTSTDTGAAVAERNRQNAEAGQAMGNAIGVGIAAAIQNHRNHRDKKVHRHTDIVGRDEAAAQSWHTPARCSADGFVWHDGGCHVGGTPDSQRTADSPRVTAESKQQREFCAKNPRGSWPITAGGWVYCDARDDPK